MPRIATDIVQYKGVSKLDSKEKLILDKLAPEYYEKMKGYFLKNLVHMEVLVKTYNEEGKRKKYSVNVKAVAPTRKTFISNKASDWDFARTLHKAFKDVETQIKKSLKVDITRPRWK
ncbi:hypothetical protein KY308_04560 [Candidatus Woesearchaeota archaeon]|nr:hypothetical protein [Candidatus Woesearchaeota archaeon]